MKKILTITMLIFLLAQAAPAHAQLEDLFGDPEPPAVRVVTQEDRSKVVMTKDGQETLLTPDNFNYIHPHISGDYVVWSKTVNGAGQIERYHIPTNTYMQLTFTDTNLNPFVTPDGRVAWEGWTGGSWQIFYFDGLKIAQVSTDLVGINATIEDDLISFAARDGSGNWRAVIKRLSNGEAQDVAVGTEYKRPRIAGGEILFENASKSPLSAEELFVLDLVPLVEPEPGDVTVDDILAEIEALQAEIDASTAELEEAEEAQPPEPSEPPDTPESSSSAEPTAE